MKPLALPFFARGRWWFQPAVESESAACWFGDHLVSDRDTAQQLAEYAAELLREQPDAQV